MCCWTVCGVLVLVYSVHSSKMMGSVFLYCIWHWRYSHDDMLLSLQDGETALMKASWKGHMECVKVLLDNGAEVNKQDKVSVF